ncbi:MAG TPA: 3'(2'),5'-bisphosphate nucleotidase [Spirochaeta sp.]|nr:3'(2'),5'-bisphosphate nucleotidase [Spirochaeta sp.]
MEDLKLFSKLTQIAIDAGNEIMKIYSGDFKVELKDDNSPLTAADQAAHNVISKALLLEDFRGNRYPVLSEEGEIPPYNERRDWEYFWLIDPLDGTKEFVKRNGEFTVNIALIEKDRPRLGIVYLPVKKLVYFGGREWGSYKTQIPDPDLEHRLRLPLKQSGDKHRLRAAGSRSHRSSRFDSWVKQEAESRGCTDIDVVTAGSSLKFCLAAEGAVDVYPRFGPTMEWDTAAAHAVVEGAGKSCTRPDGSRMLYNKPVMKNDGFIVS